jgi:hypothetical protein
MKKGVQIRLIRLPPGGAAKLSAVADQISGLSTGPAGALVFVCSPDPLIGLPNALGEESTQVHWTALYFFQNCLALWHAVGNKTNQTKDTIPAATSDIKGYRLITVTSGGAIAITDRSRPAEPSRVEPSPDKIGDLMLAEALEHHCRLQEAEAKYESALASSSDAVRDRAAAGINRVLRRLNVWKWLLPLIMLAGLLSVLILLHLWLRQRRGRLVLRVENLTDSASLPNFALYVQQQERVLAEIVGEALLADTSDAERTVFAPPPSEILNLSALPSLSISKVDVKSVLVWIQVLGEYFSTRRLVVWVGKLSRRVMVRAAIESGWTRQEDLSFEAETEEDAAWQLVTWASGYDASR